MMRRIPAIRSLLIYAGITIAAAASAVSGVLLIDQLARSQSSLVNSAEPTLYEPDASDTTIDTGTRLNRNISPSQQATTARVTPAPAPVKDNISAHLASAVSDSGSNSDPALLSDSTPSEGLFTGSIFSADTDPSAVPSASDAGATQSEGGIGVVHSGNSIDGGGSGTPSIGGSSGGGSGGSGSTGNGSDVDSGGESNKPSPSVPPIYKGIAQPVGEPNDQAGFVEYVYLDIDELIEKAGHPEALDEDQLQSLIQDIQDGAWTMAPDGRLDETSRLKNALDQGGDIVLQAGDWPTQPVRLTVNGTRLYVEPGATLKLLSTGDLTSVIEIAASNCVVIGLTADGGGTDTPAHNNRHETIRITGHNNRLINCTTRGSGRIGSQAWFSQSGFAVYGNKNLLENCVSHDSAYQGVLNAGNDNFYRSCSAYDYFYKGFNQGHNGKDVTRLTIDDWYAESSRGNGSIDFANGGIYPNGLQLDSGRFQLKEAVLRNIRIGPHPDGIGGVKLATADRIFIDGIHVEDSDDFNSASLVLAEKLGTVQISRGVLRRGVTHFPDGKVDREVNTLVITDVTLGGDTLINRTTTHDHLLVRNLIYRDCTFLGVHHAAVIAETPNNNIDSWLIENCRFVTPKPEGERAQVIFPDLGPGPGFVSQTLNTSGKLRFLNNTLEAPNGARFDLSSQSWFANLLRTTSADGRNFHFEAIPTDPRITWKTGDTAVVGNQPAAWVCLQGGNPGVWAAASWD